MGDMGDIFRFMKAQDKKRKIKRLDRNMDILDENGANYEVFNNGYHIRVFFNKSNDYIDFYPSTDTWRYKGDTHFGNAFNALGFIKNREKKT